MASMKSKEQYQAGDKPFFVLTYTSFRHVGSNFFLTDLFTNSSLKISLLRVVIN